MTHRSYRFHFMSRDGHVAGSSDANCAGDEQACSLAVAMFNDQNHNHSVEVWERARLVFRYP